MQQTGRSSCPGAGRLGARAYAWASKGWGYGGEYAEITWTDIGTEEYKWEILCRKGEDVLAGGEHPDGDECKDCCSNPVIEATFRLELSPIRAEASHTSGVHVHGHTRARTTGLGAAKDTIEINNFRMRGEDEDIVIPVSVSAEVGAEASNEGYGLKSTVKADWKTEYKVKEGAKNSAMKSANFDDVMDRGKCFRTENRDVGLRAIKARAEGPFTWYGNVGEGEVKVLKPHMTSISIQDVGYRCNGTGLTAASPNDD